MKPLKLEMECFGSFYNKCIIDFEQLNHNRLFLITGQTGSGKTTILDAMCFSLYGCATGENRQWELMRSLLAPDDKPTFVKFVFSIGDKKYKFERSLMMRNRTRNGEKVKLAETEACAYEQNDDDWQLIVKNSREALQKAQELLGLTREQFVQIIMLPQGEFKRLLLAKSKDKSDILESLFLASRWKDFALKVNNKSRSLYATLCDQRTKYVTVLQSVGCEGITALNEKIELGAKQNEQLDAQIKLVTEQLEKVETELKKLRSLDEAFVELDKWQQKLNQLNERCDETDKLRHDIEKNEKLHLLLPYREQAHSANLSYKKQAEQTKQLSQSVENAKKQLSDAEHEYSKIPTLKEKISFMQQDKQKRQLQLNDIKRLNTALEEHKLLSARLEKLKAKNTSLDNELKVAREKYKKGEENWLKALEEIGHLPQLSDKIKQLNNAVQQLNELKKNQNELNAVDQTLVEKEKNLKEAQLEYDCLRQQAEQMQSRFMENSAYSLSTKLKDGQPCPVCGSTHHPQVAQKPQEAPSKEQLELAQSASRNAFDRLQKCISEQNEALLSVTSAKKLLKISEDQCSEYDKTTDEYSQEAQNLKTEYDRLCKMQSERGNIEKRRDALRLDIELKEAEQINLQNDLLAAMSDEKSKQNEISLIKSSIGDSDISQQQLEDIISQLDADISKCENFCSTVQENYNNATNYLTRCSEQLKSSKSAQQEKHDAYIKAKDAFMSSSAQMNIKVTGDMFDNLPSAQQLNEQKETVSQFDKELHAAKASVAEYTNRTNGQARPDMKAAEKRKTELSSQISNLQVQSGTAQSELKLMKKCHAQAVMLDEQIQKQDKEYSFISRLAQLLGGKNPLNTPIHQFVLGIMLENIVQYANGYLHRFSKGKYSLVRVDREKGGHGYMGMELDVIDSYTGGSRDVKTLSGGEIFIASLSLAFGLSDAVQSFAGGIRIDSLFIDEGFGTLDSETLDTAMRALNDVLKSDRIIGIISHVEQLKDSIAARIEVTKNENGSAHAKVIAY